MTARTKKTESKPVNEETTTENEQKQEGSIMLATFKDTASIPAMEYAGFKAHIQAEDMDRFKPAELEKKLEEYRNKNAFNQ